MNRNEKVATLIEHLERVREDFDTIDDNLAAIVERAIDYIGIHETMNPSMKEKSLMSQVKLNRKQTKQLKTLAYKILPESKLPRKKGLLGLKTNHDGNMAKLLRATKIETPEPPKTHSLRTSLIGIGLVMTGVVVKKALINAAGANAIKPINADTKNSTPIKGEED